VTVTLTDVSVIGYSAQTGWQLAGHCRFPVLSRLSLAIGRLSYFDTSYAPKYCEKSVLNFSSVELMSE